MSRQMLKKLGDRHFRAIELLLLGQSYRQVVESLGISKHTMTFWAKDPLFKKYLSDSREARQEAAIRAIERASLLAVNSLIDVLKDKSSSNRDKISAANSLLDRCGIIKPSHTTSDITVAASPLTPAELDKQRQLILAKLSAATAS